MHCVLWLSSTDGVCKVVQLSCALVTQSILTLVYLCPSAIILVNLLALGLGLEKMAYHEIDVALSPPQCVGSWLPLRVLLHECCCCSNIVDGDRHKFKYVDVY